LKTPKERRCKMKQAFRIISLAGRASSAIGYEFFEPMAWVRNERYYYPEDDNIIYYNYQGEEFPLAIYHCGPEEKIGPKELRIFDNPQLTNRVFRARWVKPQSSQIAFRFLKEDIEDFTFVNLIEVNPRIVRAGEDFIFYLSCQILAHAIHGLGFCPSNGGHKKIKERRRVIEL
jgi:hypothetical protein